MATPFTSVLKANVIDPLEALLKAEFKGIPVHHDPEFRRRGNFFIRLIPFADELEVQTTEDQLRNYAILLRMYRLTKGRFNKSNNFEQLINFSDRIKRLVNNNSNYKPSSTYKWNDGVISSINYDPNLDDEEIGYQVADLTFNCNVLI